MCRSARGTRPWLNAGQAQWTLRSITCRSDSRKLATSTSVPFASNVRHTRNSRSLGYATVAERRNVPEASAGNHVARTEPLRDRDRSRSHADAADGISPAIGEAAFEIAR